MKKSPRRLRGLYAPELLESRIAPATFIVNSLLDNGDGAKTTLREAVTDANNMPGADAIVFDKTLPAGTIVLDTATGELPITEALTIKGPGIDKLTISGSDMVRIFKIKYPGGSLETTTISGLSLIDGNTANRGGALYCAESLVLKNVVIASSYAMGAGGGAWISSPDKAKTEKCQIVNNKSADECGGLYLHGDNGVTVVKSTIAGNTANQVGGLYVSVDAGTAMLDTLIISGNSATGGDCGGLGIDVADEALTIVKNCLITGNTATGKGGGLYLDNGNLIVKKSTFAGNSAARGGALANEAAKSLEISDCRFLANKATNNAQQGGGALYMQGPTTGTSTVKITGTLFSGNSSASIGGAITTSTAGDKVVLDIKGCAFLGNTSATEGGALFLANQTALTLKGSVLSGNVAGSAGGAIHAISDASITASGNQFTENVATGKGGAIHATGSVPLTLMGNLFLANVGSKGGALYADTDAMITMKGDKVLGNTATGGDGGGLYLSTTNTLVLTGLLVQGNRASGSGGGIKLAVSNGNPATISGCKILDNVADYTTGEGGGIFVFAGTVAITKSVITGNVADTGGGIFDAANTTLDAATKAKTIGNSARTNPNTDGIP